ncbi:KTSC domain-containing protein [Planctomonas deserti]|uniref:KTSC domain-containing protein n=1 Tax=Planctomonas deserti TaxID=2144185 RepID=UPI000D3D7257|nr:KTSC domain-containing protein [Planctomonas deserti]
MAAKQLRIPLESSVLEAVSYDQGTSQLTVWFVSGAKYRYSGVPPEVVLELLEPADGSHGRAYSRLVRDHYPYDRLRG